MNIFNIKPQTPSAIAEHIAQARQFAPSHVGAHVVDQVLAQLRAQKTWDSRSLGPTRRMAELVTRNVTLMVQETAREQLAKCDVFVVPLPYFGAYCEAPGTIVVGEGFIDCLTAYLYWGALTAELPEELGEVFDPDFPRTPVRDLIPLVLLGLLHRHLYHGEPMPNYRALLKTNTDEQVKHALAGGMTFTLLHELGHIELGHHGDGACPRGIDLPFQVPENLSRHKLQELEADTFARDAMVEGYRPIHTAWLNTALGPHFLFETVLSQRGTEHPICINRLVHAHHSQGQQPVDRAAYLEHLRQTSERYQSIEQQHDALRKKGRTSLLPGLSRERIVDLLASLNKHTASHHIDLNDTARSEPEKWRNVLFT